MLAELIAEEFVEYRVVDRLVGQWCCIRDGMQV